MSQDPLDLATKALRDRPVSHDGADATKRALLRAARSPAPAALPKKRRAPVWVLPLVAALAAGAALAGAGRYFASPGGDAPPAVAPSAPTSAAVPPRPGPLPTGTSPTKDEPPQPVASSDARPDGEARPAPSSTAVPSAPRVASAERDVPKDAPQKDSAATKDDRPAPPPASAASAPPSDPADDLYREAHELHFRGGSPQASVAAWDKYLAAAPSGRFALEARFNRAVALLRAGRREEGLAALAPFAEGKLGGYRKDEAKRLLDAAGGK